MLSIWPNLNLLLLRFHACGERKLWAEQSHNKVTVFHLKLISPTSPKHHCVSTKGEKRVFLGPELFFLNQHLWRISFLKLLIEIAPTSQQLFKKLLLWSRAWWYWLNWLLTSVPISCGPAYKKLITTQAIIIQSDWIGSFHPPRLSRRPFSLFSLRPIDFFVSASSGPLCAPQTRKQCIKCLFGSI